MRTTQAVLLSALVLALSFHGICSVKTLEEYCYILGNFYIEEKWCVATLSADPRSRTADLKGLGVIATNMTLAKSAVVKMQIEDVVGKATGPVDKHRAEAFLLLYSNMIATLRWSLDSLASGFTKGPAAVLGVALDVPAAGEDYVNLPGPESYEAFRLIQLSNAIAMNLN